MLLFALSHEWSRNLIYRAAQKRIRRYIDDLGRD